MATTPTAGESGEDQPDQRWTGRASVSPPAPAAASASARVSAGSAPVSAPAPPAPPQPPTYGGKKKLKPRWGRIALVGVIVIALVAGGIGLWGYLYVKKVNDGLKRTDSLDSMVQGSVRPPKTVDGALNILLLGSDSRDPDQPTNVGGNWRTDTIVL